MFKLTKIDHVGVRVSNRERSVKFYESLGFIVDQHEEDPTYKATGMVNSDGSRVHLIYNADQAHPSGNVLMDEPGKLPGYTHVAFVIDSTEKLVEWLHENNIVITEGPVSLGDGRRTTVFIRDPDRNVVEFNEIHRGE